MIGSQFSIRNKKHWQFRLEKKRKQQNSEPEPSVRGKEFIIPQNKDMLRLILKPSKPEKEEVLKT